MSPEYRIVTDEYGRYIVQWRRWWWPFWKCPTYRPERFTSVDAAERWAKGYSQEVVRYLGRLPKTRRGDA